MFNVVLLSPPCEYLQIFHDNTTYYIIQFNVNIVREGTGYDGFDVLTVITMNSPAF
jgi:hypothetical protein